jgi:hypothetical protein
MMKYTHRISGCLLASVIHFGCPVSALAATVAINEVVTDPQQDWGDSSSGVAFDSQPGPGPVSAADEWIELVNLSGGAIDLTDGGGWVINFNDTTPASFNFTNSGNTVLQFSKGGTTSNFLPNEYLVIGDPPGGMNNTIQIEIRNDDGLVDSVQLGFGGAPDGNASSPTNESVARWPDGLDTGSDADDFRQQSSTIGSSNGNEPPSRLVAVALSGETLHLVVEMLTPSLRYSVQSAMSLEPSQWQDLTNFTATTSATNLSVIIPSNDQVFLRAVRN